MTELGTLVNVLSGMSSMFGAVLIAIAVKIAYDRSHEG